MKLSEVPMFLRDSELYKSLYENRETDDDIIDLPNNLKFYMDFSMFSVCDLYRRLENMQCWIFNKIPDELISSIYNNYDDYLIVMSRNNPQITQIVKQIVLELEPRSYYSIYMLYKISLQVGLNIKEMELITGYVLNNYLVLNYFILNGMRNIIHVKIFVDLLMFDANLIDTLYGQIKNSYNIPNVKLLKKLITKISNLTPVFKQQKFTLMASKHDVFNIPTGDPRTIFDHYLFNLRESESSLTVFTKHKYIIDHFLKHGFTYNPDFLFEQVNILNTTSLCYIIEYLISLNNIVMLKKLNEMNWDLVEEVDDIHTLTIDLTLEELLPSLKYTVREISDEKWPYSKFF